VPFRWSWLLLGLLAGFAAPPAGHIRRVPAEYRTIQEAIDSAQPGDTVLVAPGRYVENIRFGGKGIVVASEYLLTRDPAIITRTIIDGSRPKHPDSASVVMLIEQEDTSAVLSGFTITGGAGTVWTDARQKALYREGGGVLCELGSPVIEHNIIEGNEAVRVGPGILSAGGGGIRCGYAEPIIRNNVIRNNRGEYGAGIGQRRCHELQEGQPHCQAGPPGAQLRRHGFEGRGPARVAGTVGEEDQAAAHGLHEHHRDPLAPARPRGDAGSHQHVGGGQLGRDLLAGARAHQPHAAAQSRLLHAPGEHRAVRPVAHQHARDVDPLRLQQAAGLDEMRLPLDLVQGAHAEHAQRAWGRRVPAAWASTNQITDRAP